MKVHKLLLTLLALGTASSAWLLAQDDTTTTPPAPEGRRGKAGQRGPGRGGMMGNPEARVAELDKALGLTADQKTKLTDIFTKSRDEMQSLRGGSGDRQANAEKARQMMQATRAQVAAVLTDEQKKKFEAMGPGRGDGKGGSGKRKKDA